MKFTHFENNVSSTEAVVNKRPILCLTIISAIGSILFMICGVLYLQETLLNYVDTSRIGPFISFILGAITCLNIGLYEYSQHKTGSVSHLTPFINIATIFLCISYREWQGMLLSIEESLSSLWIITITYIAITVTVILISKVSRTSQ
jgi:hypothetical protein